MARPYVPGRRRPAKKNPARNAVAHLLGELEKDPEATLRKLEALGRKSGDVAEAAYRDPRGARNAVLSALARKLKANL